jgi:hypothetical protein
MKALLLAPLVALGIGILTAPSAPANPVVCPPGTIPTGGSRGIQNYRCIPNPQLGPQNPGPLPPPGSMPNGIGACLWCRY